MSRRCRRSLQPGGGIDLHGGGGILAAVVTRRALEDLNPGQGFRVYRYCAGGR
jgi:hypothetical protein